MPLAGLFAGGSDTNLEKRGPSRLPSERTDMYKDAINSALHRETPVECPSAISCRGIRAIFLPTSEPAPRSLSGQTPRPLWDFFYPTEGGLHSVRWDRQPVSLLIAWAQDASSGLRRPRLSLLRWLPVGRAARAALGWLGGSGVLFVDIGSSGNRPCWIITLTSIPGFFPRELDPPRSSFISKNVGTRDRTVLSPRSDDAVVFSSGDTTASSTRR